MLNAFVGLSLCKKNIEKNLLTGRDRNELLALVEVHKYEKIVEGDKCCICGCNYKVAYHYQDEECETFLCQDCSKKYDPKFKYEKPIIYRG